MGPIVLIQANQLILIIICRPKGAALVALYAVPSASGTSMPIKPEARKWFLMQNIGEKLGFEKNKLSYFK